MKTGRWDTPRKFGPARISDSRLTNDEARRISKLISRLPELLELEQHRSKARSRRKPQPLRFKPVTIGDLIRDGKLLEVHCSNCRPDLSLSMPVALACQCWRLFGI